MWTPLGKQTLIVDDRQGESCRVEQLSQGTREQLFLAIRLAMIEQFRERGIELPVILDDVLVNFDQHRVQAAVQTLQEIAESGQQILFFTCHQHLAELFQRSGSEIINLPELANPLQKRIAG